MTFRVNAPGEARPDTYHVERHDDHEVDADAGAGGGELPVLLHKVPVEGGELLHGDETENHHGKHSCQNQRDLNKREVGRRGALGGKVRQEKMNISD